MPDEQSQPQPVNINLENVWNLLIERSKSDKELALHMEVATHAAIAQERANQLAGVESKMRDHLNFCATNVKPDVKPDDPIWPTSDTIAGTLETIRQADKE